MIQQKLHSMDLQKLYEFAADEILSHVMTSLIATLVVIFIIVAVIVVNRIILKKRGQKMPIIGYFVLLAAAIGAFWVLGQGIFFYDKPIYLFEGKLEKVWRDQKNRNQLTLEFIPEKVFQLEQGGKITERQEYVGKKAVMVARYLTEKDFNTGKKYIVLKQPHFYLTTFMAEDSQEFMYDKDKNFP